MPTVFREGPYRFLFYAIDRNEPAHVHVTRDRSAAKVWLEPVVSVAKNKRFRPHELAEIERLVELHRQRILEAWNAFFGH
jgi:hypothetical protein